VISHVSSVTVQFFFIELPGVGRVAEFISSFFLISRQPINITQATATDMTIVFMDVQMQLRNEGRSNNTMMNLPTVAQCFRH
jgi:hypothetical protein